MFDFGNANDNQKMAITTTEGPVLITAGPGTGKTFTLVQRAIYLIQECGVKPEEILMATFTEKAAKELVTRITNELSDRGISVNINDMYIGTFHSLCLRIIKEHLEFTRLKKNYRTLDEFDQKYTVFQNINRFNSIEWVDRLFKNNSAWKRAEEICRSVNNLMEELIEPSELQADSNNQIVVLGKVLEIYKDILDNDNLMDFASIQTEAYRLLSENPHILSELRKRIRYIMIDEYQDTNFIQEQIVFLIGGEHKNICVVGDDDQGLYRFRGATIRNILEFPQKFEEGECRVVPLVINYRSNSDIVDFYNEWMHTTNGARFNFSWDRYRYPKRIVPHVKSTLSSPAVAKLSSNNDDDEWKEKILDFINKLKRSGKITNYNQVAFLFRSVKSEQAKSLARFFEMNGIDVYSPRSDIFFDRFEVKVAIGCMMLMFPNYVKGLKTENYQFLQREHYNYYRRCIAAAENFLLKTEGKALSEWIKIHEKIHAELKLPTDYAYLGLLYQMFEFKPFCTILNIDMNAGVVNVRPARNLAILSQLVGKYEYLHRVNVLTKERIDSETERFFNLYFRLLYDGGINEYEDDAEYAPSGCVSFLTIHQSKGIEFPIVIVDSLANAPKSDKDKLMSEVEEKYFKRPAFEPHEQTRFFDFWRLYYTAFSRAQDLLVLTCNETSGVPSKYFKDIYDKLQSVESRGFDVSEFAFKDVKAVKLKETFSFTSHINVYETCALQYKFYKELGFTPVRAGAMLFGMLVHETIEDIHKAAIRKEESSITEENIIKWFDTNYSALTKAEHTYLAEPQRNAALSQVLRYVESQGGDWSAIQQTEIAVSLVKPDYIIEGKIDLIKGENETVEIIDFKSEKKPDMLKDRERIEQYRRQLHIYAYLVEEKMRQKVSKMHIYYTGEEDSAPTVTYTNSGTAIKETTVAFDEIVHKIMKKDYKKCVNDPKACRNCDFKFFCKR